MRQPFPKVENNYNYMVKCVDFEGLLMSTHCYESKGQPNALVFFLPGYGDHATHYGYFFKNWAEEHRLRTYSMDRRGFGESQGRRADVLHEDDILDDHWQFFESVSYMRGYNPNTPKFIIGHSMGALYATRLC